MSCTMVIRAMTEKVRCCFNRLTKPRNGNQTIMNCLNSQSAQWFNSCYTLLNSYNLSVILAITILILTPIFIINYTHNYDHLKLFITSGGVINTGIKAIPFSHNYRVSFNKHRTSNKRCSIISTAPLGIHIEISASL